MPPVAKAKKKRATAGATVGGDAWSAVASMATWQDATPKVRARFASDLVKALGSEWTRTRAALGKDGLTELVHAPTDVRFVVVPGGAFTAGMRDADLAIARKMSFDDVETLATLEAGPEAKAVTTGAFLCARTPLLERHARALRTKKLARDGAVRKAVERDGSDAAVTFTRKQADTVLASLPASFRLLTTIEWEYVARGGGVTTFINGEQAADALGACESLAENKFNPRSHGPGSNAIGVWGLPWGEWVAGKIARRTGAACGGTAMELPWQSIDAIVGCFAGLSVVTGREHANCLRVAVDLPRS